jgi:hypothetical protein
MFYRGTYIYVLKCKYSPRGMHCTLLRMNLSDRIVDLEEKNEIHNFVCL